MLQKYRELKDNFNKVIGYQRAGKTEMGTYGERNYDFGLFGGRLGKGEWK